MRREGGRLRATLALLLLVSAGLFAIGTTVERHQHVESAPASSESTAPSEGGSTETGGDEAHPAQSETSSSEELLGVDPEAPWVVALGVAASVLFALAVWLVDRRSVLVAVVAFGLLLTALDIREAVHQTDEHRAVLVALSLLLAVLHLATAGIAVALLRRRAPVQIAV